MGEKIWDFKKGKIGEFFELLNEIMNVKLFSIGESSLTIGLLLTLVLSVALLLLISEWIKKLLVNKVLQRYHVERGTRQSIGTIVKYVLIIAGMFSILQTNGIDLSAFGILAGALGVGIGFGLQNITNNFISGLIILFEQPIKVGDRIEVGDIAGDVVRISARSTTVITNDNISVIIPNSKFIDDQVINWSHNEFRVRFNFPVGVSYKEDPEKIKSILVKIATDNPGVLKTPEPDVLFDEFDESSLNFNLRVWTSEYVNKPKVLKSQLYFEIFRRFKENNVEIPFPQRDIHIKSAPEKLNI
ncbi:mechanosensitive ion channel family protein [Fontibacter flavus]|uniref:Mechanosensitive ion channel family protein n=1 Tax=Fontibacter flavus TaxID=654838 RepID=A0ABV6FXZ4_9BACT